MPSIIKVDQIQSDTGTVNLTSNISFTAGTAASPGIQPAGDTNTGIFFPAADTIAFSEGGVESMRIDASGNVGVGTSSPQQLLDVRGRIQVSNGTNGGQLGVNAGGLAISSIGAAPVSFYYNTFANESMRITAAGDVGIGTSSPAYKFDVTGLGRFTGGALINNNTWLYCQNTSGAYRDSFGYFTDNNLYITAWDGAMLFRTGGSTYRGQFTTTGNFLVGSTSTAVGIGDLTTVAGSQITADGFVAATRPNEAAAYFTRTGSNGRVMNLYRDATGVGGISVTTTATTFNTTSDYRLKDNVQPMQNALAKVSELKPVTYKWKVDGSDGQGFIAHELQEIFPDAVDGEKDAVNADGKPVYQGIDTSFLVATLTAAIQEQQQMIETLQAEVALLKSAQ